MAQIKKLEVKDINAALDELSSRIDKVAADGLSVVFPKKIPARPKPGQAYWLGNGTFGIWHPSGWEIYSKDAV
jgi:hypothetical protein